MGTPGRGAIWPTSAPTTLGPACGPTGPGAVKATGVPLCGPVPGSVGPRRVPPSRWWLAPALAMTTLPPAACGCCVWAARVASMDCCWCCCWLSMDVAPSGARPAASCCAPEGVPLCTPVTAREGTPTGGGPPGAPPPCCCSPASWGELVGPSVTGLNSCTSARSCSGLRLSLPDAAVLCASAAPLISPASPGETREGSEGGGADGAAAGAGSGADWVDSVGLASTGARASDLPADAMGSDLPANAMGAGAEASAAC